MKEHAETDAEKKAYMARIKAGLLAATFGFKKEDLAVIVPLLERYEGNSYYKLGGIMAVLSRLTYEDHGIKYVPGRLPIKVRNAVKVGNTGLFYKGWCDHRASLQYTGDKPSDCTAMFSPYHLTLNDMREIVKVCDENDLDCQIAGFDRELYFPGHALDIRITHKSTYERRKARKGKES